MVGFQDLHCGLNCSWTPHSCKTQTDRRLETNIRVMKSQ